jgi:signal transduction histidine kinase
MKKNLHYIFTPILALTATVILYFSANILKLLPYIVNIRAVAALILLTIVLYTALRNGVRSALISAIIAEGYFITTYSMPGKFLHYSNDNQWRIVIIGITLSSLAILVGTFRQKFYSVFEKERLARKKVESKMQKLQKSGELKEEFLSIASHELKTPITSIKLGIHMLRVKSRKENDPKLAMQLDKIDNQVDNLTRLINDLLDVSKMTTGKVSIKKQSFNIDELINEKIDEISAIKETHTIIKKGHATKAITADRARIGQVIINLVTNAIRYSPQANKIIISVKEDQTNLIVSIQDYGEGIAKNHQKKIFERFYQVYDAQRKGALGIGLYISNQIVKLHNGNISVESKKGQGATFSIALPYK